MRKALSVTALVGAVLVGGAASGCQILPDDSASATARKATVISIADGDTIKVRQNGHEADVRFIGIDTPESSTLRTGAVDCGGPEAKAAMERLLQPGDQVKLVVDPSQDRRDQYGRLLRYVEFQGRDLGATQVVDGLADVYVYDESAPPRRTGTYRRAQAKAEAAGAGVYGLCGGDFHSSEN